MRDQRVEITPNNNKAIGKYKVFLTADNKEGQKFYQTISIEVYGGGKSKEEGKSLNAAIETITRSGKVIIKFNQQMLVP